MSPTGIPRTIPLKSPERAERAQAQHTELPGEAPAWEGAAAPEGPSSLPSPGPRPSGLAPLRDSQGCP